MKLGWKEIMEQIEQLNDGQTLKFKIPQTFGGGFAVIELNQNKGKKFLLKLGKDENATPYSDSDKPKDLAKWVADRQGESV
jgi:parvulin-like peptidyl-prolyl isomerase